MITIINTEPDAGTHQRNMVTTSTTSMTATPMSRTTITGTSVLNLHTRHTTITHTSTATTADTRPSLMATMSTTCTTDTATPLTTDIGTNTDRPCSVTVEVTGVGARRASRVSYHRCMRSGGLPEDLRETVRARIHAAEQRFTPGRERCLAVLANADGPLTIPEIVEADRSLATSSVYRNVIAMEALGIVHCVTTVGDFQYYELSDELTTHHHHLVCSSCGSVDDIAASARLEQSLRDAARDIARRTGFRAERHRVDIIGLCGRCS
jgi:Fur family transcriptional regulator, ferric uptake regulator